LTGWFDRLVELAGQIWPQRTATMPKVTQAHLDARKEQIMDAAHRVFARKGFHQATMQDICAECELSPGAVYRYFPSKDDIIRSCGSEARQNMQDTWESLGAVESTLEILEGLLQTYLVDALSRPDDPESATLGKWALSLDIELWAESLHNERVREGYVGLIGGIVEPMAAIMQRGQERGEINPDLDPISMARVLFGCWMGLLVQVSLDPSVDRVEYTEMVRAMVGGTFWRGGSPCP